jgi:serine/threonine protein kinase
MRGAAAKSESIVLIRHIPVTKEAWLQCRLGMSRMFRGYEDCWAEFRDSCILLYRMPRDRASNGNLKQDPASIAKSCALPHIEVLPLRHATVALNAKKQVAHVQKSDRTGVFDLKFPDKEVYEEWTSMIRESIGLRRVTLADFEIQRHVGKGASGRVYLVTDRVTKSPLALKVIEKSTVLESEDSYRHALDERIVLEMAGKHPFILDMKFAFQNRDRLFLVTDFCAGGDLFEYLNKKTKPMEEGKAKYVAAEIFLALEYIHGLGVVYRDLKLENVLLDENGHVRLADFGLSKLLRREDSPTLVRTNTFCGTREYVAPEMLARVPYDTSVDLWAFGILLYEILCGRTPFYSKDREEIYERIQKAPVFYPKELSEHVQDLLQGLLQRDTSKRLGVSPSGLNDVKRHAWFSGVDWDALLLKQNHKHTITTEVQQMSIKFSNMSSEVTDSGKKSKRRIAQEKALESLLEDAVADSKAVQCSSPTLVHSFAQAQTSGSKTPKVVPVQKSRKRTPIIAGYSFNGKWTVSQTETNGDTPHSQTIQQESKQITENSQIVPDTGAGSERGTPNETTVISSIQPAMFAENKQFRMQNKHSASNQTCSVDNTHTGLSTGGQSSEVPGSAASTTGKDAALSFGLLTDLDDIVDKVISTPGVTPPSAESPKQSVGFKRRFFIREPTGRAKETGSTQ